MRIDRSVPEHAHMAITLSRRNLLALLAKLDGHPPDSAATLVWGDPNGGSITVRAEENDPHYGSRGYGPGPMVSDTEDQIDIVEAIIRASGVQRGGYPDEWQCEHGVGHPYHGGPHHGGGIHGCDGCCAKAPS